MQHTLAPRKGGEDDIAVQAREVRNNGSVKINTRGSTTVAGVSGMLSDFAYMSLPFELPSSFAK